MFGLIDSDDSGSIDGDKLRDYMRRIGHIASQQEVDEMITVADLNGDGVVDLDEFLKMME